MSPTHPFPTILDNSSISLYKTCPFKFWASAIRRKVPEQNIHLIAGKALHKGLEVARLSYFENDETEEEALAKGAKALCQVYGNTDPGDTEKTRDATLLAYGEYLKNWPLSIDPIRPILFTKPEGNVPSIEFSFAIPLPIQNPSTSQDIIMAGRLDMFAKLQGRSLIVDEKTTSQIGPKWSEKYRLDSQFTTYAWALREYGLKAQGVMIRGVSLQKNTTKFAQAITYRPDWRIARWYESTMKIIRAMIRDYTTGSFIQIESNACSMYGGCGYSQACELESPEMILSSMQDNTWSPLK